MCGWLRHSKRIEFIYMCIYIYIHMHICIILNPWNNHTHETHHPPQKRYIIIPNQTTLWSSKILETKKGPTLRRTTTGDVVMWFQCQCHRWVWPRWWMNRCIQGSNLCRCRTGWMDGKGDGWMDGWMVGRSVVGVSGVWGLGFRKKPGKKLADDRDRDSFFDDYWLLS